LFRSLYTDLIAREWGVKRDIEMLDALMHELERIPLPDISGAPAVARRLEDNN
jgi:hypothetical protein